MEAVQLGLRANWRQFWLLVGINGLVGAFIGIERAILPAFAATRFGLTSQTVLLSFIVVFGVTKALTNYFTGRLSAAVGRRNLLILGWLVGLPVPFLFLFAPAWSWIIAANVLLGINQGLAWSSTVVMKVDLAGPKDRGLAMGLNEFAGYVSVAFSAYITSWLADTYGVVAYPFYWAMGLAGVGLALSVWWVKDTAPFTKKEAETSQLPRLQSHWADTSWKHPQLASVSQAGFVNNLNDGMVWGLLPILLAKQGFGLSQIGLLAGIYPAVWGFSQVLTGHLADKFCKKKLLFSGMLLQGAVLLWLPQATTVGAIAAISIALGIGTALVYPTFLATIAENTHPADRAESLGIFRFWRDLGYAAGALLTGLLADRLSTQVAIWAVGGITLLSAFGIAARMRCRSAELR